MMIVAFAMAGSLIVSIGILGRLSKLIFNTKRFSAKHSEHETF